MPRTLPTFHRLGTTQCEAGCRVCCRSAESLFAMLQIIKIIIFDCTCNHKMQCELKWSDSGMLPLPCIRSYTETMSFSLCRKKPTQISEKCQLMGTVLLTSKSILVSLVHFSTDIRCGQWETLSNKRAGQQNDTSVQLEKSFITFPGAMLPGRRRGCCWRRCPVKQREMHRDLLTHTSTKDLKISFQRLLLQKALWHGKQARDPSISSSSQELRSSSKEHN